MLIKTRDDYQQLFSFVENLACVNLPYFAFHETPNKRPTASYLVQVNRATSPISVPSRGNFQIEAFSTLKDPLPLLRLVGLFCLINL